MIALKGNSSKRLSLQSWEGSRETLMKFHFHLFRICSVRYVRWINSKSFCINIFASNSTKWVADISCIKWKIVRLPKSPLREVLYSQSSCAVTVQMEKISRIWVFDQSNFWHLILPHEPMKYGCDNFPWEERGNKTLIVFPLQEQAFDSSLDTSCLHHCTFLDMLSIFS